MSRRARRSPRNPGRGPNAPAPVVGGGGPGPATPRAPAGAERPAVQILVVVANIQMRTLKAKEGKGSM